jgi:hypothetical protein
MAMRFHNERDKRLHPMRHSQIEALPPGNQKFAIRRRGTLAQRPFKRPERSEVLLQGNEIADDSIMITVCYEAHLSMQQMLAALAEIRGDDAEGQTG